MTQQAKDGLTKGIISAACLLGGGSAIFGAQHYLGITTKVESNSTRLTILETTAADLPDAVDKLQEIVARMEEREKMREENAR